LQEGSAKESVRLMIETGMLFALFPSFLAPFEDEKRREYFLNSMETLDRLRLLEENFSIGLYLALFLIPFLDFYCPMEEFPPGRKGLSDFHLRVREWLINTLGPFSFTRHSREAAAQLLAHQRTLHEFGPLGRLPLRLVRRPDFSQVLHLFQLASKARGEEPIKFSWPLEEKRFHRRKRKRRFRRKTRRPAGGAPGEPPRG
jgi:hypothetical protein